jgi:hypothetical protein
MQPWVPFPYDKYVGRHATRISLKAKWEALPVAKLGPLRAWG